MDFTTKVCKGCRVEKPLGEFPKAERHRDGKGSHCKPCVNEQRRQRRKVLLRINRLERTGKLPETLVDGMKVCRDCGQRRPLDAFRAGTAVDGKASYCRHCDNVRRERNRKAGVKTPRTDRPAYDALTKQCSLCKQVKPRVEFCRNGPLGSSSRCRACNADYLRARTFGISLDQYRDMIANQGGVCAICHEVRGRRGLAVDHDHEATGSHSGVRDLLCGPCNMGLGLFKHDPALLRLAISYLEKWAGSSRAS